MTPETWCSQSQLLFYTSQQYLVSAAAQLPHTTGSFGAEIRPLPPRADYRVLADRSPA